MKMSNGYRFIGTVSVFFTAICYYSSIERRVLVKIISKKRYRNKFAIASGCHLYQCLPGNDGSEMATGRMETKHG